MICAGCGRTIPDSTTEVLVAGAWIKFCSRRCAVEGPTLQKVGDGVWKLTV